MKKELFEQIFSEFNNLWNKEIVTYFDKFLSYISNCDPRKATTKRAIENAWTNYLHLHHALEREIRFAFKDKNLTPTQSRAVNNYFEDIKRSLTEDQQTIQRSVRERKEFLKHPPLPMPTLQEQIEAHEIFPDNPAYYKVSF